MNNHKQFQRHIVKVSLFGMPCYHKGMRSKFEHFVSIFACATFQENKDYVPNDIIPLNINLKIVPLF